MQLGRLTGLIAGPLFFIVFILSVPQIEGSASAASMLAILGWMLIWWVTECVPLAVTALLPLVFFPLMGIMTLAQVGAEFGNPLVFLFLGGFILARAIEKWGLHERIAFSIIKYTGVKPVQVLVGFALATAFLSMWISNTATAVMMLPIALSVMRLMQGDAEAPDIRSAPALLLIIAWSANVGGMMSLIGTPPNLIYAGFTQDNNLGQVSFSGWFLIGLPPGLIILALVIYYLSRGMGHIQTDKQRLTTLFKNRLEALGKIESGERLVLYIFVATALLWIMRAQIVALTGLTALTDSTIALMAAISLFIIGVKRPIATAKGEVKKHQPLLVWDDTKELPWGILLLFGGGLALASGLRESGMLSILTDVFSTLGEVPLWQLILLFAISGVFITEVMSNMAFTAAFLPLVLAISTAFGMPFQSLALPMVLGSSCAFMFPMATPPNAVVFSSGLLKVKTMAIRGFWVNLMAIAVIFLWIWMLTSLGLLG